VDSGTYVPELNLYTSAPAIAAGAGRLLAGRGQLYTCTTSRAIRCTARWRWHYQVDAARHARTGGRGADADPERRRINGGPRTMVAQASRNGHFCWIRVTGEHLPHVEVRRTP